MDTNKATVARAAIEAGASVINDTSGLGDSDMAAVIADGRAHLVVCHRLGVPRQEKPALAWIDSGQTPSQTLTTMGFSEPTHSLGIASGCA